MYVFWDRFGEIAPVKKSGKSFETIGKLIAVGDFGQFVVGCESLEKYFNVRNCFSSSLFVAILGPERWRRLVATAGKVNMIMERDGLPTIRFMPNVL